MIINYYINVIAYQFIYLMITGRLDAERAANLQQNLLKVWEVYFLPADTNHDGSVELRELVTYMRSVNTNFVDFSFQKI